MNNLGSFETKYSKVSKKNQNENDDDTLAGTHAFSTSKIKDF